MRAFGISLNGIVEPQYEVRPDCWNAIKLFSQMGSHFEVNAMGYLINFDWHFFDTMIKYSGLESPTPDDFESLLILEHEAVMLINKRMESLSRSKK